MMTIKDLEDQFPRAILRNREDNRDAILITEPTCPQFYLISPRLLWIRYKGGGIDPSRVLDYTWMMEYYFPYLLRPDQPIRHHITVDTMWTYYTAGNSQQTACTFATMYLDTILYFMGVNATFVPFDAGEQMRTESIDAYRKKPIVEGDSLPMDYDIHRNSVFGYYIANESVSKHFLNTAPVRSVGEQVAILSPQLKWRSFDEGKMISLLEFNVWMCIIGLLVAVPVIDWLIRGAEECIVTGVKYSTEKWSRMVHWPRDNLILLWLGYTSVLLANSGQLASDNSSITFVIWTVAAFLMQNFWSTDLLGCLLTPVDYSVNCFYELWTRKDLPWERAYKKFIITDPSYYWYSLDRSEDRELINFSTKVMLHQEKYWMLYNNEVTIWGLRYMILKSFYFVVVDSNEYLQVVKDLLFDNFPWHLSENRYFWDIEFLRVNAKHRGSPFEKDLWRWYYLLEQHGIQIFMKRLRMIHMKMRVFKTVKVLAKWREENGVEEAFVTNEYFQEKEISDEEEEIGMRYDSVLAFCYLLFALLTASHLPLIWELALRGGVIIERLANDMRHQMRRCCRALSPCKCAIKDRLVPIRNSLARTGQLLGAFNREFQLI